MPPPLHRRVTLIALALVPACGISNSSGRECAVVSTYVERFTLETGGSACPAMSEQTLRVDPGELTDGSGAESSDDGSGSVTSGCSDGFDPTTCTWSTACEVDTGSTIALMSATLVFDGPTARGTEKLVVSSADGTATCTYAIDATPD